MRTSTFLAGVLVGVVLLAVAPTTVQAGYVPDKIVPLPEVPYPDCTNKDSGTVVFDDKYDDYIVVVENKLIRENWKEWAITYTITPLDENNWYLDPHVDYSEIVDPTGAGDIYEHLTMDNETAWWDTGIFGSNYPDMPLTWTVIGYPSGNPNAGQIVMSMFPNAHLTIDTMPFDWNPEWVSLEFYGQNVQVEYEFIDFCIPEPGTLSLLALGALVLKRRKA